MRRILLLLVAASLLVGAVSAADNWWDADYMYRQVVHLDATPASENTQVELNVTYDDDMQADFDDLRFTDSDNSTELDYWVQAQSDSNWCNVWVEVADTEDMIVMYYGNDEATSASDGEATFPFFDTFDGTSLNTSKWTSTWKDEAGGYVTVSGGKVAIGVSADANGQGIRSVNAVTLPLIFHAYVQPSTDADRNDFVGFHEGSADGNKPAFNTYHYAAFRLSGSATYRATIESTSIGATVDADNMDEYSAGYHELQISRNSTGHNLFYFDDVLKDSDTTGLNGAGYITLFNDREEVTDLYADWVFLRTYTATDIAASSYSEEEQGVDPPVADFTNDFSAGSRPLTVTFTDTSTNTPTSWSWDFGDGSENSTAQNPSHQYVSVGVYTVALTVSNAAGSDTEIKVNRISVGVSPTITTFSANDTYVVQHEAALFSPTIVGDNISAYNWSFGDGTANATTASPSHTFDTTGDFTITLTVVNALGQDTYTRTDYIHVGNPPVAAFAADAVTGEAPVTITFTDSSTNTPTSWSWNFGDGDTSVAQNPSHLYSSIGTYSVTLTATNAWGSDDEVKTDYITINGSIWAERPKANATVTPLPTEGWNTFMESFGGSDTWEDGDSIDWRAMGEAGMSPYVAVLGSMAFVIFFAIPFVMSWLVQGSTFIPGMVGLFEGLIIFRYLPAEFQTVAYVFMGLSVVAIIYGLMKSR